MNISENKISLYRKIDDVMKEKAGVEISKPRFSYVAENEENVIHLPNDFDKVTYLNQYDSLWSPIIHDLTINQSFFIKRPEVFFGEQGVSMPQNQLGIAAHIHSASSHFQKTISFGTITSNINSIELPFHYQFPRSSLRGNVEIDYFIYLKTNEVYFSQHANEVGMNICDEDIENILIIIDSKGSIFPITEYEDKNGQIWKLQKNWIEPGVDGFDSSNINLCINTLHPLFGQLKKGKLPISRAFMNDIILQAITLIVQQIVIVEEFQVEDMKDALPGSILSAVYYWVTTFDIDITNLFTIRNSLKDYWAKHIK